MKKLLLICSVLTLFALTFTARAEDTPPQKGLKVLVEIGADSENPEQNKATATITEAGAEEILAAPTIVFAKVGKGETWSQTPDGRTVHFVVRMNEAEKTVTCLTEIASGPRGETIIFSQETIIHTDL